jgi:hypothetical protein
MATPIRVPLQNNRQRMPVNKSFIQRPKTFTIVKGDTPVIRPSVGSGLVLPTEKRVPVNTLELSRWLIFGKKKIGKTDLASQFPGALIVAFEPGTEELDVFDIPIPPQGILPNTSTIVPGWKFFTNYIDLLEHTKHQYQMIVIDTGFVSYNRCLEYVCWENGWAYPSEGKDRGIGWRKVSDEFANQLTRIEQMKMGVIVICHDKMLEQQTSSGSKFDIVVPKLSSQADDFFRATIQNVGYYHYRGHERYLTIRGSDYIMAGVGSKTRFRTPEGLPIYSIPMGNSAEEGYQNFLTAFNNQQLTTFESETARFADEEYARSVRQKAEQKAKYARR